MFIPPMQPRDDRHAGEDEVTLTNDNEEPSAAYGNYGSAGSLVFGVFIAAAFIFCIVIATTLATGLVFLGKGMK